MSESCTVIVENTGEEFACATDAYILDAGLEAGLRLPHSCRGGACGQCKAQVLEGEVDHGWINSFGISDEEKADGFCLTCQSKPLGGRLRLRTVEEMAMAAGREAEGPALAPRSFAARVLANHPVTPSIRELVVQLRDADEFRYRAGMNMDVVVPGLAPNRCYSMASAPDASGRAPAGILGFYVTRHPQGRASGWIHEHLASGAEVELKGPYGEFSAPDGLNEPVLLLAGGSGLSPVLSIVRGLLARGMGREVDLVLSVRAAAEVFALRELAELAHGHGNFRAHVTLTREAPPPGSGWHAGRVPEMLAAAVPDAALRRCFIAGPPGFVDACTAWLRQQGAADSQLQVDSFTPAAG